MHAEGTGARWRCLGREDDNKAADSLAVDRVSIKPVLYALTKKKKKAQWKMNF